MKRPQIIFPGFAVWLSLIVLAAACAQRSLAVTKGRRQAVAAQTSSTRGDVARFRSRLEASLAAAGAAKGYWGALVTDADTGEVLYALNPGRYFEPASNAKLFTTAMALATLGPDFRIRTTIETTGKVDDAGRLHGSLVLVGRGDPNLSNRVFPFEKDVERSGAPDKVLGELADQVVAAGVKEVDGDVIADDSYFTPARFPSGWTVDDTVWSYGAAVSAIAVNDNAITLTVTPGAAAGAPLTFDLLPWSGFYHVQSDATTTRAGTEAQLRISREPESETFVLSGTMPAGAPARALPLAVPQPAEHAAALLLLLLEARGVHVDGSSKARHAAEVATQCCAAPPAPAILAQHLSPPLLQDVQATNKLSLNLHAEMMLRLAAKEKGNALILDDALKFAEQFRQSVGIARDDVQLTDGSGLSRNDLVTPQSVVQWLAWATRQKWGADFAASLAVAGQDGTLENRMKGTAAAGRVHAKTGLVERVEGISGYATTLRGEHLIFSMFGNNQGIHSRSATDVLDAICVAMVEELGSAPAPPTGASRQQ